MPAAARRAKSAERSGVQANGSATASPCLAPGGVGTTGTFSSSDAIGQQDQRDDRARGEHDGDQRDAEAEHLP